MDPQSAEKTSALKLDSKLSWIGPQRQHFKQESVRVDLAKMLQLGVVTFFFQYFTLTLKS